MLLGCIADDLTGATDLAGGLVREGLRVQLAVGVPRAPLDTHADAVVVALKSRSIAAGAAVEQSLEALERLRAPGTPRIYFKYASTFDSTPAGNIGPVTEALQDALGAGITVACPAFPANGRTVADGRLFVDGLPLAESHMRHHPLNPMAESDLLALLGAQTRRPVGLVPRRTVADGRSAIRDALDALERRGVRHAIVDAADAADLRSIASAVADDPLVTGGSALAAAIAADLRVRSPKSGGDEVARIPASGPTEPSAGAVIAGSCSAATLRQVTRFAAGHPIRRIDPAEAIADPGLVSDVVAWAAERLAGGPVLIATSAEPSALAATNAALGPTIGRTLELVLADVAAGLVARGVRRLIVAGGETSGAVIERLGIDVLHVGREIEPGVPIVAAEAPADLRLALKSGNFGSDDFFAIALDALASGTLGARGPASRPERGEGS